MEIMPGVHRIDGVKGAHAYLFFGAEPVLVDTGLPGQAKLIMDYLQKAKVEQLKHIVLTHFDVDHTGNAAALKQLTGAKIYAHQLEVPFIEGVTPRPGLKKYLPILTSVTFGKLIPVKVDIPLKDGDLVAGLSIIATPGHTPGHICIALNKVVAVGDLLQGGVREAPRIFIWDKQAAVRSIKKLAEFAPHLLLPGHGQPDYEPKQKLQQLLENLTK